jgi:hypothetical protein
MTRLFSVSGDTELAKRTLRLYAQVVSKAQEAQVDDFDTDRHWVETLINGARMLCRLAMSHSDSIDDANEAGEMIEKSKTRLDEDDKEMVAKVALAEGVWYTTMAIIGDFYLPACLLVQRLRCFYIRTGSLHATDSSK